jgi:CheY-like chemotaxis protein
VTEQCRHAGCQAVLLKPIQPRELLGRVAEWLR